ncbi:YbjN domain-containing protein [Antarcticirhabdus aurantiaca]|uniref:YbjN domain-containing protein n=1 Tax=Antarcticirhabdus aurantiaca TaxID=2606717 RepID=A0ACD4NTN4_9HYPH|nr:YbjN domain-containing protein [Antarcticirhabdus aurantiaca]WAJ30079.1 YbjN domain-containing protein [Jeongeuplla avenae]
MLEEWGVRRATNPVDVVEGVASARCWAFERSCDDEIELTVAGHDADYSVSFSWMEPVEALHLGCAFDMEIPLQRLPEVLRLLAKINEQLLIGHFDLWLEERAVVFRNSLLLAGGAETTDRQAERLLASALDACERFGPAFRFVVRDNRRAEDAMAFALFETAGAA